MAASSRAFQYPTNRQRHHGPDGYQSYESYRDWLRDEFMFRCAYCLHREQWYGRGTTFQLDHFVPVSKSAAGTCQYDNLFYACASCNNAKRGLTELPDPGKVDYGSCLRLLPDGSVEVLNKEGERIEKVLRLNRDSNVAWRRKVLVIEAALYECNREAWKDLMGFPTDLPDLRRKKSPRNTRPAGAANCFYVQREKGRLADTY